MSNRFCAPSFAHHRTSILLDHECLYAPKIFGQSRQQIFTYLFPEIESFVDDLAANEHNYSSELNSLKTLLQNPELNNEEKERFIVYFLAQFYQESRWTDVMQLPSSHNKTIDQVKLQIQTILLQY